MKQSKDSGEVLLTLNTSPYKFRSQLLCPFGPRLGHYVLNDAAVERLTLLTDEILNDPNRKSRGDRLAGQVSEEPDITDAHLRQAGVWEFFHEALERYVEMVDLGEAPDRYSIRQRRPVKVGLQSSWIVSQYENEYNPIHWHPGCTISGVLYLKVPEFPDREHHKGTTKKNQDGKIVFLGQNHTDPDTSLENATFVVHPVVGEMYLWPSRLMHCVYPFQGPGERRCIAFNGIHRY